MIIYKITNLINGKIYVGQTIRVLETRWDEHIRCANDNINYPLYNSINKYGLENFKIEILENDISDFDTLDEKEIYWIKKLNTTDRSVGYNLTEGGQGIHGYRFTDEQLKTLSESHKGYITPEETKRKLSDVLTGNGNPMYGKQHTQDTVDILRKKGMNRVVAKKSIEKMKKSQRVKYTIQTPDGLMVNLISKDELYEFLDGKCHPEWLLSNGSSRGYKFIKKERIFRIYQYTKDNEYIKEYDSAVAASKENRINSTNILQCCAGNRPTAGGYIWKYQNNN